MVKWFMTILLLLVFGALPVATQTYQVVALAQADGEETMECCAIAGQCKMNMQEGAECQTATDTSLPCFCDAPEPKIPFGLLTTSPQLPLADDTLMVQAPLTIWAEFLPTNARLQCKLPPSINPIHLRHACLRI